MSSLYQPLVSVGIPTFNRPEGLKRTLELITAQTYQNLEIIISDNATIGNAVELVIEPFLQSDKRIKFYKQSKNKGASFNFKFVLDQSGGDFFMWAADDDYWDKLYIEKMLFNLHKFKVGVSFCNIHAIDKYDRSVRVFEDLHLLSGNASLFTVSRYLFSPEIMGKANIIYGLFVKEHLVKAVNQFYNYFQMWGSDMTMNLFIISHFGCYIDKNVLFKKRGTEGEYSQEKFTPILITNPKDHIFPLDKFDEYLVTVKLATQKTSYKLFAIVIMYYRYIEFIVRQRLK